jgi:hypothetical protein
VSDANAAATAAEAAKADAVAAAAEAATAAEAARNAGLAAAEIERRRSPTWPPAKPDTGRNDATAIDQYSVEALVEANAKLAPFMLRDVPIDLVSAWARMQARLTHDLETAQSGNAADPVAVDRALKWLLISHSLVLRGRTRGRGRGRFRDTAERRLAA